MASTLAAARPLDALYDPIYTVKDGSRLHVAPIVERVPNFSNFFSELPTIAPPAYYRFKAPHLPPAPTRTSAGSQSNAGSQTEVTGRDRSKYFKRPIVPLQSSDLAKAASGMMSDGKFFVPPPQTANADEIARETREVAEESKSKTVGTQTLYRESDAQTDPYTPDYKLPDGQTALPEVLAIAHLSYGKGLPATMEQVHLIERLREKRQMEANLPPPTDPENLALRKAMLREQELKDWKIREQEIRAEQDARLTAMVEALKSREEKGQQWLEQRVEQVKQNKTKAKNQALQHIHRQRIKVIRSIKRDHAPEENPSALALSSSTQQVATALMKPTHHTTHGRRDIIAEYADAGSTVYAPILHEGAVPPPRHSHLKPFQPPLLNSFHGLETVYQALSTNKVDVKVAKPTKEDLNLPSMKGRANQQAIANLHHIDKLIQSRKNGGLESTQDQSKEKEKNKYKQVDPVIRPPTPSVDDIDDPATVVENDEPLLSSAREAELLVDRAVILIQRLIRGRAVQNVMFEGRMHYADQLSTATTTHVTTPLVAAAAPLVASPPQDETPVPFDAEVANVTTTEPSPAEPTEPIEPLAGTSELQPNVESPVNDAEQPSDDIAKASATKFVDAMIFRAIRHAAESTRADGTVSAQSDYSDRAAEQQPENRSNEPLKINPTGGDDEVAANDNGDENINGDAEEAEDEQNQSQEMEDESSEDMTDPRAVATALMEQLVLPAVQQHSLTE